MKLKFWKNKNTKQHAKKCASLRPKYHGDMRIMSNYMLGDCDCDGYHTFNELYEHRSRLFIALCNSNQVMSRKSRTHEDGSMFDGMFIATLQTPSGQISYHLENNYWDELDIQEQIQRWDGHTSDDVLERLKSYR